MRLTSAILIVDVANNIAKNENIIIILIIQILIKGDNNLLSKFRRLLPNNIVAIIAKVIHIVSFITPDLILTCFEIL